MEMLESRNLLYLGDSSEDRLMVEDARRSRDGFCFGGVYGVCSSQRSQSRYFEKSEADLVMKTVDSTAEVLGRLAS
jgi:hypothetical protein